jgi:antitoxin CcdA
MGGRKRAANVSIDSDILEEAKKLNINLSQTLEDALRHRLEGARIEKWQRENRAFFDAYNAHIERVGTMSEALLDLDDPSV